MVDIDASALDWVGSHPASRRLHGFVGDISDEAVARAAADRAVRAAPLAGWVNNAAVFRDASVHSSTAGEIMALIDLNLRSAVAGCAVAVRHFLATGTKGSIVNVTSHQARQAVPGCRPYATAKTAIEGMTRALAVEYGRHGIRTNAVAPGTIVTERYRQFLASLPSETAARIEREMAEIHPLGRPAEAAEVAAAVCYLLSPDASFINGVTLPVDGARTVLAREPAP